MLLSFCSSSLTIMADFMHIGHKNDCCFFHKSHRLLNNNHTEKLPTIVDTQTKNLIPNNKINGILHRNGDIALAR